MKKLVLAPLFAMAVSHGAFAQDHAGPYIGAKYGKFMIDVEEANEPTDGGFLLGYNFGNGASLEVEHDETTVELSSVGGYYYYYYGSLDLKTTALYVAFRTPGDAYLKAKLGVLKEDITSDYGSSYDKSDSGLSAGIGAGFNAGDVVQLEVEYTVIEQDVSFLSAGINLRF